MSDNPQARVWNDGVGDAWSTHADHFDVTLEPMGEAVLDRLRVGPGDRVVDIGCGTGATTVRLARAVAPAMVTGVDLSVPMLATARRRAVAAKVANVEFIESDVEAAPFATAAFDVAFSRFGVMFFPDPVRAVGHIRRSLVDRGRLGFVCFHEAAANPFIVVPVMTAAAHLPMLPPTDPTAPGPFSLGDPERTRTILDAAGFTDVVIETGPTSATLGAADDLEGLARRVLEQNPGLGPALSAATAAQQQAAVAATAAVLADHVADGVVSLAAGTWIVTATAG